MRTRRFVSLVVTFLIVTMGVAAMPAQPALADGPGTQIVSDNPANFTPNVLDGEVEAITSVGNRVIIGGQFGQVANATVNGGTVYNRTNLAALNATTGVVDTGFNPSLNGSVNAIIPAGDGTSVYVAGSFTQVNGTATSRIARINVATGQKVAGFTPGNISAQVRDIRLVGNTLYIAGFFTTVAGQPRSKLASLNATTGALTAQADLLFEGQQSGGTTSVNKIEVTPAGDRMLVIGNFRTVDGLTRRQVAMLDLSGPAVTLAPWNTNFFSGTCASVFNTYMRDLDISEDGTFVVISTTGAYRGSTSPCDTISRWPIYTDDSNLNWTWIDYTGGDTTYAVEIARGVAYAGGHMRWVNNPHAGDQHGPGGIPREGIVALDVVNGMPFSWDPGRARGVGVFDFYVTDAGMWAGSDTLTWAGEQRNRLAFFPWAGGTVVPEDVGGELPNDVYLLGRTSGGGPTDPSVLYRVNGGGPALPSADDGPTWEADTSGTSPWRNSGSNAASWGAVPSTDGSLPDDDFDRAPLGLFSSERWDPGTGEEMQWTFPVTAGTNLEVRLYLANRCTCTDNPGERVYDIQIDGATDLDDLDLADDPGHDVAMMRSFDIVSDGAVNILFLHNVENPLINGIEIIDTDLVGGGTFGVQDDIQRRFYNGVTGPAATTVLAPTEAWGLSRGAWIVNNNVYSGWSDGSVFRRTFNGTTWGPRQSVELYGNNIIADLPNVTGLLYDPADERIYYTMSGSNSLFWRHFTPESHSVGAQRYTATGSVGSLNPSRVRGMFLSGGEIFFADNTTGNLLRIGLANGVVTGSATVADNTVDWRARGMFVWTGDPAPAPNQPPTASFTFDCTGLSCDFDGTGSSDIDGTVDDYDWDFGDGTTDTGATPSHTYATGDMYTVTLTVTDDDGDTGVALDDVTVIEPPNQPPTASFTFDCTGLFCDFDGTASSDDDGTVDDYDWDFGDGTTDTGATPSHDYGAADMYTVTLTVTDNDGATDDTSQQVSVVDLPNQAPTASFTVSCTLLECDFDGTGSSDPDGTIDLYDWDFGDGDGGNGATASHTYRDGDTYTVTLTATDDDGATDDTSQQVTVSDEVATVAFRGAASSNGNVITASVTAPGAIQEGDQLILIVTTNRDTTVTTPPAGWTLLGTEQDGSPDMESHLYTRTAPAGFGGSTVSVTLAARSKTAMTVLAYSGAGPVTVFESSPAPGNTAAHDTPGVTVGSSGSFVVSYWADKTGGNAGWTLPGNVTLRNQSLGSGGGQITSAAGDTGPVAAGPWAGATATS
ncbi:MAG TPA: PKD domain-containing protein, partial [Acidimicrobiia bacterium]